MSKTIKLFSIVLIMFSLLFSFYDVYASDIDMNLTEQNVINDDQTDDESSTQVVAPGIGTQLPASSISSVEEEGLSFTNILNILLITVGVILILLSVAIILRLR